MQMKCVRQYHRTMRDNCSAAPRLQHCVEITSVSFTVSAVLSRSRLGLEGNCLGLVLVSADSENKCLCLVSVSNTNCLVSVSSRLKLSRTQHCNLFAIVKKQFLATLYIYMYKSWEKST